MYTNNAPERSPSNLDTEIHRGLEVVVAVMGTSMCN
jgi:hypothetical protein